jgi:transposase
MNRKHSTAQEGVAKPAASLDQITKTTVGYLQMFMTETLAKRIAGMMLIAAGIEDDRVAGAAGLSKRSIWTLKKTMAGGDIDGLFEAGGGSGRPVKAKNLENAIIEELDRNNYHTRQQIADMILEKFGVAMSVSTVGRLLKKRHQKVEKRVGARKGQRRIAAGFL